MGGSEVSRGIFLLHRHSGVLFVVCRDLRREIFLSCFAFVRGQYGVFGALRIEFSKSILRFVLGNGGFGAMADLFDRFYRSFVFLFVKFRYFIDKQLEL